MYRSSTTTYCCNLFVTKSHLPLLSTQISKLHRKNTHPSFPCFSLGRVCNTALKKCTFLLAASYCWWPWSLFSCTFSASDEGTLHPRRKKVEMCKRRPAATTTGQTTPPLTAAASGPLAVRSRKTTPCPSMRNSSPRVEKGTWMNHQRQQVLIVPVELVVEVNHDAGKSEEEPQQQ